MEKESKNITGIILCGGKSKGMGKNKALLRLGDKFLIEHVIGSLEKICHQIILSTNNNDLDFLPYQKIRDKLNNIGPIAGFHATLNASKTIDNLIVSCDSPFVSEKLLLHLIKNKEQFEIVLPSFNKQLQPMIGYFNKKVLSKIESEIKEENMKPINIFEKSNLKKIIINKQLDFYHDYLFFNINNQEDFEKASSIYRSISA